MKRLMLEESCVHGYFGGCTFRTDEGTDCPGGTSREVTVDYTKAAWMHLEVDYAEDAIDEDPVWAMAAVSEGGFAYRWVKSLVDAALGGGL